MKLWKVIKKNGNWLIIAVIVLLIILIGLVGFDIYKNVNNKENSTNKEENKTEIPKLTKDSYIVKKLFDLYNPRLLNEEIALEQLQKGAYYENVNCSEASDLFIENYVCYGKYQDVMIEGMKNKDKFSDEVEKNLAHSNSIKNFKPTKLMIEIAKSNNTEFIPKSNYDAMIKDLYGKDYKITYNDIYEYGACALYHYDKKLNGYIHYGLFYDGCGDTYGDSYELKDIEQDDNRLTFIIDRYESGGDKYVETFNMNFKLEEYGHYVYTDSTK